MTTNPQRLVKNFQDGDAEELARLTDDDLQAHLLEGVSRTFALTIPQLPGPLCHAVSNAYLLCRIVDTIEDEPTLSTPQKRDFCGTFTDVVTGRTPAQVLAAELAPLLSEQTLPAEHNLIRLLPRVIGITHKLTPEQRRPIERCVAIMADGMAEFQAGASTEGLSDLPALDQYCYYVAGVVGEMLTELFCAYSPAIARNREALLQLSVSFGQGLQMTNILKDIWEDRGRGVCWLPRDAFAQSGFDLGQMDSGPYQETFGTGLASLIGIAHGHLKNALTYSLIIPREETGIRNFCLWAAGMAVLTLRRINERRDFQAGRDVKISRRSVRLTIAALRMTAARNTLVRALFFLAGMGLPGSADAKRLRPLNIPPRT